MKPEELFFVKDEFFEAVNDPYLMRDKGDSHKRPHFFAIKDNKNDSLFWIAPITSQVPKFDAIVQHKQEQKKQSDGLFKTKVNGKDRYILFQNMFLVTQKFLYPYTLQNNQVTILKSDIPKAVKQGRKAISLLKRGVVFTRPAPNIPKIINFFEKEQIKDNQQTKESPFNLASLKKANNQITKNEKNNQPKINKDRNSEC